MRDPNELMSSLIKDVNHKYRNRTKTQVDDRCKTLPRSIDLNMQLVDEIKYTEGGVLKTLYPTDDQAFFAVSGLVWKYPKFKQLIRDNSLLINNDDTLILNEDIAKLILRKDCYYTINNEKKYGLDLLYPFLFLFYGELIPWSCIKVVSTVEVDYIIIQDTHNYITPGSSSVAALNILDCKKYNLDYTTMSEVIQFYSDIVYLEYNYITDYNNYTYADSDCKQFAIFGSFNDVTSSRHTHAIPIKFSDPRSVWCYMPPITSENKDLNIDVLIPYSLKDSPPMMRQTTLIPLVAFKNDSNASYGDYRIMTGIYSYSNPSLGEIESLYFVDNLSKSFSSKDTEHFRSNAFDEITVLNSDNCFSTTSGYCGSCKLFNKFVTRDDYIGGLSCGASFGIGYSPSGMNTVLFKDYKNADNSIYVNTNDETNHTIAEYLGKIPSVVNGKKYPYYEKSNDMMINGSNIISNGSSDLRFLLIQNIMFFDNSEIINKIKKYQEYDKSSNKIQLEEEFIFNNRTSKKSSEVNPPVSSYDKDNVYSSDAINPLFFNLDFDANGLTDLEFLAYVSMHNMSMLMDTIKDYTPIFQTTFYVSSTDHEFYNMQKNGDRPFIYRGENGEPNYIIEFINGAIPSEYAYCGYHANKFDISVLPEVSTKGDTYEFIHFTDVYNHIFEEKLSWYNSQGISSIIGNMRDIDLNNLEDNVTILAQPIGDSSYQNHELYEDTAGYKFYFGYPFDMGKLINVGYFCLKYTDGSGSVSVVVINNGGVIRYKLANNVYYNGSKFSKSNFPVNRWMSFGLDDSGAINSATTITAEGSENVVWSFKRSDSDNKIFLYKGASYALSNSRNVKGVDYVALCGDGALNENWPGVITVDTLSKNVGEVLYSFDADIAGRVYLNEVTDTERDYLKNLDYENVCDFYGNKKYVDAEGNIVVNPMTYRTYGSDFYFDPSEGYPWFELDYRISTSGRYKIVPKDSNYVGELIKIIPETRFKYAKMLVEEKCVKVDLPMEFQFCRKYSRYLVFLNGLLVDTSNFRIISPKPNLPFDKVSIYTSMEMNDGDELEVFYLPHELSMVEYRKTMINKYGDIIVDFGSDQEYPFMQYLTADTCMVFINGKKIPSTKIKNISMNRLSILASDLTSIDNLVIYSFIPFFPLVSNSKYLTELLDKRNEMLANPDGALSQTALYNILKKFTPELKSSFTSLWDTIVFKLTNNILIGGYTNRFDSSNSDVDLFSNALDDIAVVYEVIRDNYVRGIVTMVPFAYNYDDVIFDTQVDITGEEVLMEDSDGVSLINIENALLEHSFILDRDYNGYAVGIPEYNPSDLAYDTAYIQYTSLDDEDSTFEVDSYNLMDTNNTNKYYISE